MSAQMEIVMIRAKNRDRKHLIAEIFLPFNKQSLLQANNSNHKVVYSLPGSYVTLSSQAILQSKDSEHPAQIVIHSIPLSSPSLLLRKEKVALIWSP